LPELAAEQMSWTPPIRIPDLGLPFRAAQYVRMSTDEQTYSIENQAAAIAAYAVKRNLTIVRTYVDSGRSGLRINTRKALQTLITDVEGGLTDFDCILVYDISRWGRFQNVDESAYYEFICRRAGITVHYCEEQFENDGSFVAAIIKNVKRVAAADYSRQLSAKVFAGACRIIGLGFKQGGIAGYGLERRLLDQYGNTRLVLALGDRKALVTDRVVLQPGQADQVATVQRVFRSFVADGKSEYTIANELNQEQIFNEFGRPWRMLAIRRVLTCEKYLGHYVYNKKSGKLRGPRKPNPPEDWVRFDNAFESIIDLETFRQAGQIIESRPKRTLRAWKTDAEMLSVLAVLLKKHGHLSAGIIDRSSDAPCTMTYIKRFGSLRRAYELIGFHPDSFKTSEARSDATATMVKLGAELLAKIQGAAVSAAFDGATGWLTIGVGLTLTILLARCQRLPAGNLRWPIRAVCKDSDLILTVRMQQDNISVLDYYLVPKGCFPRGALTFTRYPRKPKLEPYRLATLDAVVSEIQRYQCVS
jgi:DNA invertase Pin-like site-specific DNA recombinase